MRIGVVLDLARVPVEQVPAVAAHVEAAGHDLLWLRASDERPYEPLVGAAGCAGTTGSLHVGAEVTIGSAHPVYLAEERHVVDQLLCGRLVLALRGRSSGGGAELSDWAQLLLEAARTVPFAHAGPRNPIPAGLPDNTINPEDRVIITPQPFSLEPQLWVTGDEAAAVAAHLALPLIAEEHLSPDDSRAAWIELAQALGGSALRLRRPAVRDWDPEAEDAGALALRLVGERDGWGVDTVVVRLAPTANTPGWHAALGELARVVRPRVQMSKLPAGLEDFWARERSAMSDLSSVNENETIERR